jgi:cell division protease FtsH
MCATLGGRAAEQLIFNKISTGALSDLERVTKQAYAMISIYGLNERVGNISYYDSQGRDAFTKPYSDDTAKIIDEEVSKLIESQYQRALQLLGEHKDQLEQVAGRLLTSEVIFKEDLEDVFGKRPWDPEPEQTQPEVTAETVAALPESAPENPSDEHTETSVEENASETSEETSEENSAENPAGNADANSEETAS